MYKIKVSFLSLYVHIRFAFIISVYKNISRKKMINTFEKERKKKHADIISVKKIQITFLLSLKFVTCQSLFLSKIPLPTHGPISSLLSFNHFLFLNNQRHIYKYFRIKSKMCNSLLARIILIRIKKCAFEYLFLKNKHF